MGFLETNVSLQGTKFKQELLDAAKKFLVEIVTLNDHRWLKAPKGPLGSYWNQEDAHSAAFLINIADIFGVLQSNVTERSIFLLKTKLKNLLRPRNDHEFNELFLALQFVRALSERVSPISFEPVLPDFLVFLGGRARGPDYCIRLPDGDVAIEFVSFYPEPSQKSVRQNCLGKLITVALDAAYGFDRPQMHGGLNDRMLGPLQETLHRKRSRCRFQSHLVALTLVGCCNREDEIIKLAETEIWTLPEYNWLTGLLVFTPSPGFSISDPPPILRSSLNPNAATAASEGLVRLLERNGRFHLRSGKFCAAQPSAMEFGNDKKQAHKEIMTYVPDQDHAFFLSRFKECSPGKHQPIVAELGRVWIIDFRKDRKAGDGWCFACVATRNWPVSMDSPSIADYQFVPLGRDPYKTLPKHTIGLLEQALDTTLASNSLADILMELLLLKDKPGGNLAPSPDGKYQIYLKDLLMELSTEEAYTFLAQRLPDLPGHNPQKFGVDLAEALAHLQNILAINGKGWLTNQLSKAFFNHPLIENYRRASDSLHKEEDQWNMESVIWIKSLVYDWLLVRDLIPISEVAARLRDPIDCESLKYELSIMAGYRQAGASTERTDKSRSGEFRVSWGQGWVYVECKRKEVLTLRDRAMGKVYQEATQMLFKLMGDFGIEAIVCIRSRNDINEKDVLQLKTLLTAAFQNRTFGTIARKGKIEIEILPSIIDAALFRIIEGMPFLHGYESQTIESVCVAVKEGVPSFKMVKGVAWKSHEPSDWLGKSVKTYREAAGQLKKDYPGIVYLQVPEGSWKVVLLRITNLRAHLEAGELTRADGRRVNVVVVTGAGFRERTSGNGIIWSTRFETAFRKDPPPRNALPPDFKIFGRDFTRTNPLQS
jgi:hypothetical protein